MTSYLSLISLGIGTAVTRYLIKYRIQGEKEKEEQILGLFMLIFRVIAIAAFLIGIILIFNLTGIHPHTVIQNSVPRCDCCSKCQHGHKEFRDLLLYKHFH